MVGAYHAKTNLDLIQTNTSAFKISVTKTISNTLTKTGIALSVHYFKESSMAGLVVTHVDHNRKFCLMVHVKIVHLQ